MADTERRRRRKRRMTGRKMRMMTRMEEFQKLEAIKENATLLQKMFFEDVLTFLQSSINPYLFVETLQIFLSNQSNVYYHMFVQIALGGGCIFTLVAFV